MSIKNSIKLLLVTALLSCGLHTQAVETTPTPSTTVESLTQHVVLTPETYINMSATELAELVKTKQVSTEELINLAFQVNEVENPKTNALITTRKDLALQEASKMINTGQPFFGVPIVVKGLGHSITGGSNSSGLAFNKDVITKYTGPVAKSLQELGFVVIGQSNYPQLGLKNISDSTLYGPVGTPWNPNYQAGGSSGGSGAAVASGVVPVASGSDAGGSIRIPASWNGLVGLKPSRGIIKGNPAKGQVVHFPLSKNMEDTQTLFDNLLTTQIADAPTNLQSIKIGYTTTSPVGTPVSEDAKKAVMNAVQFLNSKGFITEEINLPYDGVQLMKGYYEMATASGSLANYQASQVLKRGLQMDDVDLVTWALFQASHNVHKEDIDKVNAYNNDVTAMMEKLYQDYPLILTPTTASTAPELNDPLLKPEHIEQMKHINELKTKDEQMKVIYDQWLTSLTYTPFTQLANLTGQPAISLPTYVSQNNLPLGIQFNAATNQDKLLLEIGKFFEDNHQFKQLHSAKVTIQPDISETGTTSSTLDSQTSDTTEQTVSSSETINNSESTAIQESTSVINESTNTLDSNVSQTSESSVSSSTELSSTDTSSTIETSESTSSDTESSTTSQSIVENTISSELSEEKQDDSIHPSIIQSTTSETTQSTQQSSGSLDKDSKSSNQSHDQKNNQNVTNKTDTIALTKSHLPKTSEVIQRYLPIIGLIILLLAIILWVIKQKKR